MLSDRLQPRPSYTLFTHPLPDFPLPTRRALPDPLPRLMIATPCKNASAMLETYFALIEALDYPRERLHLRLLEGDSSDDTYALAKAGLRRFEDCASAELLKLDLGVDISGGERDRAEVQRDRRAAIAACRNALLRAFLESDADEVLFIDVDMAVIPPDALRRALEVDAPIRVANCRKLKSDENFDANSFRYTRQPTDLAMRRFGKQGIYQPPSRFFRHYPPVGNAGDVVPLHSVGGTFLLIRRDVAEAGVDFPETPYQYHLETEGLALKAADHGFGSFMLPGLIVRHGDHG